MQSSRGVIKLYSNVGRQQQPEEQRCSVQLYSHALPGVEVAEEQLLWRSRLVFHTVGIAGSIPVRPELSAAFCRIAGGTKGPDI